MMTRVVALIYGIAAYAAFFVTFLYLIGFVGNVVVPKSINSGASGSTWGALLNNIFFIGLFGIQHTVMARPAFKERWTKIVPRPVERSTYVLITSLLLCLIVWRWQPMTGVVWEIENSIAATALWCASIVGWGMVLYSTFLIDHFDLFGLRQVYLYARGRAYTHPQFAVASLYKYVRHPLLLGFLIAFWSTPRMTLGHLVFCVATTVYLLVGVQFEERDLARFHGEAYEDYRRRVPMLIPSPRRMPTPQSRVGRA
jgi:protein-S-isoprenylcysteine O-methyltransferase Ste14